MLMHKAQHNHTVFVKWQPRGACSSSPSCCNSPASSGTIVSACSQSLTEFSAVLTRDSTINGSVHCRAISSSLSAQVLDSILLCRLMGRRWIVLAAEQPYIQVEIARQGFDIHSWPCLLSSSQVITLDLGSVATLAQPDDAPAMALGDLGDTCTDAHSGRAVSELPPDSRQSPGGQPRHLLLARRDTEDSVCAYSNTDDDDAASAALNASQSVHCSHRHLTRCPASFPSGVEYLYASPGSWHLTPQAFWEQQLDEL